MANRSYALLAAITLMACAGGISDWVRGRRRAAQRGPH
jgi:hypothetical protein